MIGNTYIAESVLDSIEISDANSGVGIARKNC